MRAALVVLTCSAMLVMATGAARSFAAETRRYECNLRGVVDGDTISCDVDLGFAVGLTKQSVRIAHINAPELHSKDPQERQRAQDARDFVTAKLGHAPIYLDVKPPVYKDKYGRILAVVVAGGEDVGAAEVAAGLAKPWEGEGAKP